MAAADQPHHTYYLPKGVVPLTGLAEPADAQVAAVLGTLALEHVSGVLEIDGSPAGTIYFDQGQITFARASWIPDLSARLRGALRPAGKLNDLLDRGDRPDFDLGDILIRHGLITTGGLQEILRSVVIDTLIALTAPPLERASVSDIRFQAPGSHWAASFCQLDVPSVSAEAASWAHRISQYGLARSTPVALRDLDRSCAVLKREQWDIAATMGRPLSAQELAWQHGLALYDVIERVGGLVQAGLCVPRGGPPAAQVPPAAMVLPHRNPSRAGRPGPVVSGPVVSGVPVPGVPGPGVPGPAGGATRPVGAAWLDEALFPARSLELDGFPQAGGTPRADGVPRAGGPSQVGAVPQVGSAPLAGGAPLTSRVPRPAGALRPGGNGSGSGTGSGLNQAAPELLRRVLDGLRELS